MSMSSGQQQQSKTTNSPQWLGGGKMRIGDSVGQFVPKRERPAERSTERLVAGGVIESPIEAGREPMDNRRGMEGASLLPAPTVSTAQARNAFPQPRQLAVDAYAYRAPPDPRMSDMTRRQATQEDLPEWWRPENYIPPLPFSTFGVVTYPWGPRPDRQDG